MKTLRVFVPGRETFPITFQTGMLSNALPKLTNLRNVHCSMRWKDMYTVLRILETISHRLTGLSLMYVRALPRISAYRPCRACTGRGY